MNEAEVYEELGKVSFANLLTELVVLGSAVELRREHFVHLKLVSLVVSLNNTHLLLQLHNREARVRLRMVLEEAGISAALLFGQIETLENLFLMFHQRFALFFKTIVDHGSLFGLNTFHSVIKGSLLEHGAADAVLLQGSLAW